ncbi:hypothetical protein [Caecibacteroides pullorum]|uniref:Uncharacterized protein n=1 Tax=Caecibacteroides pullorum TaxID=2725562 RepID=A0AA40ZUF8_9BACT|nr:hypothetical protein [Caecibacteroides pullorum]MBM6858082.1 hypothetical protein [Caecibacteroides pullorum]MBV8059128.1 hypothetical protein [Caecibacteroides pullorum]
MEFVKQFLVPKLRELQMYMVKFAKQFLVPKWHELQKYMVVFKERMTMKRMVVMCLLLVAVVCGILALARGDGKQDWEKEPYPFEIEKHVGYLLLGAGTYWSANSILPVTVVDGKGHEFDIQWGISVSSSDDFSFSMGWSPIELDLSDEYNNDDYDDSYVLIEFSNGQKYSLGLEFSPYEINTGLEFYTSDSEYEEADFISMCRSYDITSVRCFYCWNSTSSSEKCSDSKELEALKIRFKDFNSAATINTMLNSIEKRSGSDFAEFGKVLTKGSSSSDLSEKSISSDSDDDEEKIDSVLVEKSIVIKSVETQHNVVQNGQKGMNIIVNYNVEGMKGKTGDLNAYFYFEDGTPLKDGNKSSVPCYGTYGGSVVVGKQFTPRYDDVAMSSTLFMPYDELHLRKGKFSLKYYCAIFDDEMKQQATSDWRYFTFTRQ